MSNSPANPHRFDIALSFPGEHRDYVHQVAESLTASNIAQSRLLYDKYHDAELARADLDVYLPNLYRTSSDLIVIFLCPEYSQKRWCRLEWRYVRQLLATIDAHRIMFLSFGDPGDLSQIGILSGDGYIDLTETKLTPKKTAEKILERLHLNRHGPTPSVPPPPSPPNISPTRLRHTADRLIGRDPDLARLTAAWHGPSKKNVLVIRAFGGVGKTSLVATWMSHLAQNHWPHADKVFDWTFYSQGTRDQGNASSDTFIHAALTFFHDPDPTAGSPWDKGTRLAKLVAQSRTLLVLDGLEPLQYPPGPVMPGELKDPALSALLKRLATQNPGLCIVTTREYLADIKQHYGKTCQDLELSYLTLEAGAALLHHAGARRAGAADIAHDDDELKTASREVQGHGLTLQLLGQYLALAESGDIRKRDTLHLADADQQFKNDPTRPYGHAFKTIEAYAHWFQTAGPDGQRQLAILKLLGLFDRPALKSCVDAFRAAPAIPNLTEPLLNLPNRDWTITLSRLQQINLLTTQPDGSLDAHPLLREYFAYYLRINFPESFRSAHHRLYTHLASAPDKPRPALEDLQPLYQSISHACHAGLQSEACASIYRGRILRGNDFYSITKLGATGSDLSAIACFFEFPWSTPSPVLSPSNQSWLLGQTAFYLRALGRLTEALDSMRAALADFIQGEFWEEAAISAGSLSELHLTLGDIPASLANAQDSVTYADRSGNIRQPLVRCTTHADALYQSGQFNEVDTLFRLAEKMQAELQPEYSLLYSLRGFLYCDFLLSASEHAAWQHTLNPSRATPPNSVVNACRSVSIRATQTLQWAERHRFLLDSAFDHLTLSRCALYTAILANADPNTVRSRIDNAISIFRSAGQQQYLPLGLLTRSLLHQIHDLPSAQEDLDEAHDIASRGPMRLHLADIHLHRARLFFRQPHYPWISPAHDLAEAERLITECGYHRRDQELADAKRAILP